ncbi:MAG: hypothetical protein IIX15_00130 [Clostridia bacterium]|nr:hypothetical protein [Clostridia bacterium]
MSMSNVISRALFTDAASGIGKYSRNVKPNLPALPTEKEADKVEDTNNTPTEAPSEPSGTGGTKVSTGAWNADGSQYVTGDGLIWTPDEYGILYADIDGQKVTWGSYYEGTAAPVYTSAETESGGYSGYLSSYPSYEEYLMGDGAEIQSAYSKAVQNAKQEYAMNRATYGARGEQLGRAGLTGSGYGDYLEGAAYSAMQGAISQAELGRAQSYAAYLTEQQQSAASYAAYLTQKEEQDAADRSSYINGTLYQYALSNSSLTAEDLMRWANGLDPSLGGKSHNLTYAEAEKLLTSAATQRKMNGTDAAFIDNLAYGVAYDGDGNLLTMKTEEEYRRLLAYWELSEEEMQSVLNKIQQHYGMTFEEGAAENAETAATQRAQQIEAIKSSALSAKGVVTRETIADLARQAGITLDDSEMNGIVAYVEQQTGNKVMTVDQVNSIQLKSAVTAALLPNEDGAVAVTDMASYEQWATLNMLTDEQREEGRQYVYQHLYEQALTNIDAAETLGAATAGMPGLLTVEQINDMVDKTITKEQADDLIAKTQQKAAELLNKAYSTYMNGADDEAVRAILGIDAETWGGWKDAKRQTELFRAACDKYDTGLMSEADMTAFVDRLVNDRVNEDDFDVEDLGKLAIELENNLQPKMWETYLDKLADLLMIEKDGTVNIRGTECEIKWLLVSDHPLGIKSDVTGKGEITCINGKLYQYTEEYYQGMRVVRQVEIKLKQASEDQERSIEKLIIRALSKKEGHLSYSEYLTGGK